MTDEKPKPGEKSDTISAIKEGIAGAAVKGLASVTTSKDEFVKLAGISDLYEVEAAKIALARSGREDVREFAQEMIRDHSKTTEELKSMLGAMNEPETPPDHLDKIHQTMIDDLNGASDSDFDKRYIAQQESAHSGAITLFKTFRDRGDDSALRELCRLALPVLEKHMAEVRQLARAH